MKITIELSDAEYNGVKEYLGSFECKTPTKIEIKGYVQSVVSGVINAPQEAVSDYIKKLESLNDKKQ